MQFYKINFIFLIFSITFAVFAKTESIEITAIGVADANAEIYKKDRGLMLDNLRTDAKKRAIEKAVGCFVSSETIVENFQMIKDRVVKSSSGMIKRIISEGKPEIKKDGFAYLEIKAEVRLGAIENALTELSQKERISLIKEKGNPKISVSIQLENNKGTAQSEIAENILKEKLSSFGYRVWSKKEGKGKRRFRKRKTDFLISGKAKIFTNKLKSSYTDLEIEEFLLNSWTITCEDELTGEEIYFNNQIPKNKRWGSEDLAIKDIGELIASEFNQGFFDKQLMKVSTICQLEIENIPSFTHAKNFQKEILTLRKILNCRIDEFDTEVSFFEVEMSDTRESFLSMINYSVIEPLNKKLGSEKYKLVSAKAGCIKIIYEDK